jgi:hypothetical protein
VIHCETVACYGFVQPPGLEAKARRDLFAMERTSAAHHVILYGLINFLSLITLLVEMSITWRIHCELTATLNLNGRNWPARFKDRAMSASYEAVAARLMYKSTVLF